MQVLCSRSENVVPTRKSRAPLWLNSNILLVKYVIYYSFLSIMTCTLRKIKLYQNGCL